MEQLEESYEQSSAYPRNLVCSNVPTTFLKEKCDEFSSQAPRLFCEDESSAAVDLLERPVENKSTSIPKLP